MSAYAYALLVLLLVPYLVKPPPTARQLGSMSKEQLRRLRRCELCLERYEDCGCRLGVERRRELNREDG